MDKYEITGMSCAACQARVEKAVSNVTGVDSCSVSLLTNSMGVEGTAPASEIIKAVEDAGYGARIVGDRFKSEYNFESKPGEESGISSYDHLNGYPEKDLGQYREEEEMLRDKETPLLKKRLILSMMLLIVLMYFSMGHMMLGLPLPSFMDGNHVAMGILQMMISAVILLINRKFFISGTKSVVHGAPNMDTLVAMGSGVSFIWSVFVLFKMTYDVTNDNDEAVMQDMNDFYFESAAMIVTLITIGKMLEAMSKGKTTNVLKGLMNLAPKTATLVKNIGGRDEEVTVKVDEVNVGDIFSVRAGENVPVDGVIISGSGALDESALTGESIPVDKKKGDEVQAATTNTTGYIRAEATRVGRDTTLSKVIEMVSDASATKAPIARIADKVSAVFVPAVIVIAIITMAVWLILGKDAAFALSRGISVLVISCPCALGLATPVAIMVGSGVGAKNGILFKTSESLEMTGRVATIALDKTGTITKGTPVVTDVVPEKGYSEDDLIRAAYSLESKSEHPIAKAIVEEALSRSIEPFDISDYETKAGSGVVARLDGKGGQAVCGNLTFISGYCDIPDPDVSSSKTLGSYGKTCIFVSVDGSYMGLIAVADEIKDDSRNAVKELRGMGVKPVMLTGDKRETALAIAHDAGIDDVVSEVMPDEKVKRISDLKENGKVAMVGDGINDAPALTTADIGMAIGAGADIAIDAADVVLVKSSLMDAAKAIRLSKATLRNIHENLFWAFFYNILLIPLAAGVYTHFLGWTMDPMWGAAAMSLSSFCVCMNSLRLNLIKLDVSKTDERSGACDIAEQPEDKDCDNEPTPIGNEIGKHVDNEEHVMEKVINVEGMMCEHCEMTVKNALETLDGVESAEADHEKNRAVVALSKDIPDNLLVNAVESKDYKVTGIEEV